MLSEHSLEFLPQRGEMARRARAFDWTRTPLGAPAHWPANLRSALSLCLSSRFPILVWWGDDYRMIYNDAYIPFLGQGKHPDALGRSGEACWREIWPHIGPMLDSVMRTGVATWSDDEQYFFDRALPREEVYVTFTYGPIFAEDGRTVEGIFCPCTETTEKIVGARRMQTLSKLGVRARETLDVHDACTRLAAVLAENASDVAFAAIFRAAPGGLPLVPLAAAGVDAAAVRDALAGPLARAVESGAPVEIDLLACGVTMPGGAWPEPAPRARAIPLRWSGDAGAGAVVVLGASPRRPFNAAYASFQDLVAGHIETAIANAFAYEQERKRAEALAEIDRGKTAFFSNISHEFRTPLTLLLGPLEDACAHAGVPEPVREQLRIAHGNSARLLRLVNALLDFAQIEAGRLRATFRPTDLAALTRDIASRFRSTVERGGLAFEVDCPALPGPVHVDADLWEKIVSNLLSNAFKFTLHGSIRVSLRAGAARTVVLEVADTGVGIAPADRERLFERFYRVEGQGGRSMEGAGIGLALAKELVAAHGGTIEVASEPGRGSTFSVTLRTGAAHLPARHVASERAGPAHAPRPIAPPAPAAQRPPLHGGTATSAPAAAQAPQARGDHRFASTFGARILVADDNADMRHYLNSLLGGAYRVEAVADGARLLDAARRERPDLVLTDVMMPNLDGFAVRGALREDPRLREVPVILLSARAGEEARIAALDAGVDDYLVKPFSARELLARIGAVLERDRQIRERLVMQERLRLRTAQFETLVDVAPIGVFLLDAQLRFAEVNPVTRRTLDAVPDLVGRDFREVTRRVWRPAYAEQIIAVFEHTLATGEQFCATESAETRADTGRTEYYEWQVDRIVLSDGCHGLVCYFRDISAQVQARCRLQQADRQKDEFLAMLAHELRNPLAPVRHAIELLAAAPDDAALQARVTPILMRQTDILGRLVEDLLEVSRITRGLITLRRETVSLDSLAAQAADAVRPFIEQRRHALEVIGEAGLPVFVDPSRLVQCVVNLMNNAAKYTEPGGRVRVETFRRDAWAVLRVADNGRGIPQELLPHVFNLFVQGERTLDRREGGLGIGLSIVARLVDMHGGAVGVESAGAGRGACFEIALPLARPAAASTATAASAPGGSPELPPDRPPPAARRVLVVDDNVDAADALAALLSIEGHQVKVAYSALDALALAPSFEPSAILLDIGLPGMDGHEVARRLRAMPAGRDAQLVAVTGYGQAADRERALAAGFDAHLVKPVAMAQLQRLFGRDA
ncbi:ATP-binding protein [Burkholderia glumae]